MWRVLYILGHLEKEYIYMKKKKQNNKKTTKKQTGKYFNLLKGNKYTLD